MFAGTKELQSAHCPADDRPMVMKALSIIGSGTPVDKVTAGVAPVTRAEWFSESWSKKKQIEMQRRAGWHGKLEWKTFKIFTQAYNLALPPWAEK